MLELILYILIYFQNASSPILSTCRTLLVRAGDGEQSFANICNTSLSIWAELRVSSCSWASAGDSLHINRYAHIKQGKVRKLYRCHFNAGSFLLLSREGDFSLSVFLDAVCVWVKYLEKWFLMIKCSAVSQLFKDKRGTEGSHFFMFFICSSDM